MRAEKMISGLAGEEGRWKDTVKYLGEKKVLLIGDCLVAAGMVAYSGAFTTEYRLSLEKTWWKWISELGIPHSKEVTMK